MALQVKSMGKSLSHGSEASSSSSIVTVLLRHKSSKKYDDIMKEINEGEGPLTHSGSKLRETASQNSRKHMEVTDSVRDMDGKQCISQSSAHIGRISEEDMNSCGNCVDGPSKMSSPVYVSADDEPSNHEADGPSMNLEDFEVYDSAKERVARRTSRIASILDYVFRWRPLDRRRTGASSPREVEMANDSNIPHVGSVEEGEAHLYSMDGSPSCR